MSTPRAQMIMPAMLVLGWAAGAAAGEVRSPPQKVTELSAVELGRNIQGIEEIHRGRGRAGVAEIRRFLAYPHPLVRRIAARKLAFLRDQDALPLLSGLLESGNEPYLAIARVVIEAADKKPEEVTQLAEGLLRRSGNLAPGDRADLVDELVSVWCEFGWQAHLVKLEALREMRDRLAFNQDYGRVLLQQMLEERAAQDRESFLFGKLLRFEKVWEYEAAIWAITELGTPAVPKVIGHVRKVLEAPQDEFSPTRKRETCLTIGCLLLKSLPTDPRSLAFLESLRGDERLGHPWVRPVYEDAVRWVKEAVPYPYRYNRIFGREYTLTASDDKRTAAWYGPRKLER